MEEFNPHDDLCSLQSAAGGAEQVPYSKACVKREVVQGKLSNIFGVIVPI